MKKRNYLLLLLCMVSFLLTGCVKFNANMDIKKDKSMDFSIIYAVDTSLFGDQELLEEKEKKVLEEQGFTVTEYSEDKMKGFTISRKIKNIDTVSSSENTEYSLSGILEDKSDNSYIFKVKKGLLTNTYTAKFKFDASDSDLNGDDDSLSDSDISLYNEEDDSDLDLDSDFSDMDFSGMMSSLDLSFNVTLPYSAKNHNASTANNDDKSLRWNLSGTQIEAIEFEFELYNWTTIYILLGILVLLIIILIILMIHRKKNNGNPTISSQSNVNSQMESQVNQPQNIQMPTSNGTVQPSINNQMQSQISQPQNVQMPTNNGTVQQNNNNPFHNGMM